MPLVSFEGGRMAFDPFSWAIGFTLTRTAGCLFKKAGAETFADRLRETVLKWSRGLPEELSDLNPNAVVNRLFETETTLEEVAWLEVIKICATRDGFLLRSRLPIIYNQLAARWPIAAV
jgi:hypothetical protein